MPDVQASFTLGLGLLISATAHELEQVYLRSPLNYAQQFFQYFGVLRAVESFLALSRLPESYNDCFRLFGRYESDLVYEPRLPAEQVHNHCLDYYAKLRDRIRPEPHRDVTSKHCEIPYR